MDINIDISDDGSESIGFIECDCDPKRCDCDLPEECWESSSSDLEDDENVFINLQNTKRRKNEYNAMICYIDNIDFIEATRFRGSIVINKDNTRIALYEPDNTIICTMIIAMNSNIKKLLQDLRGTYPSYVFDYIELPTQCGGRQIIDEQTSIINTCYMYWTNARKQCVHELRSNPKSLFSLLPKDIENMVYRYIDMPPQLYKSNEELELIVNTSSSYNNDTFMIFVNIEPSKYTEKVCIPFRVSTTDTIMVFARIQPWRFEPFARHMHYSYKSRKIFNNQQFKDIGIEDGDTITVSFILNVY
jgi:hypothetical protein